jgi:hypothetical protein
MIDDDTIRFSNEVEELVWMKDIDYIEAVIILCQKLGLEIESVATLLSPAIKSKIEEEAEVLRLIPKTARLPF